MHQHRDPPAERQPGQERQPVLGVDHDIGPDPAQRSEADAGGHHGQAGPDVHAVGATGPVDLDAVDHLTPGRARVPGGTQRDVDTFVGQARADAL